eukprot:GFUD01140170.1.p1 GENE.GFUD01140170.1~~GFUD01140170.1.p1  ORF type:complete len:386 (+),score=102.70 GFUD01140170.1:42-1160(+)
MALFPTAVVRQIAFDRDYRELEVSPNDRTHLLRFSHPNKRGCGGTRDKSGPVKICVYFTTGKVSTSLEHPRAGRGQLQRSVGDLSMLALVFDNPRVHSNTGYHKTEETRKKHKENGLDPKKLIVLASEKYQCSLVPGCPQDRNKLLVFKHPTGVRIRVWVNTGTVGIMHKHQEVYVKKVTMRSIETYLNNPLQTVEGEKFVPISDQSCSSSSVYRPALVSVQPPAFISAPSATKVSGITNLPDPSRLVSQVDRNILAMLAGQDGFSKTSDQKVMIQFKNQTETVSVNVYTTKGTVVIQGKGGLKDTRKGCQVSEFLELLGRYKYKHQFDSSMHQDSDHAGEAIVQGSDHAGKETALMKALRKAREDAANLYH